MSAEPLPDFHHALMLSRGDLDAADLAECHGVLCGMICVHGNVTLAEFIDYLRSQQVEVESGTSLRAIMQEAFERTAGQLDDEDLGFHLWLPDDEEDLEQRTHALAQWCGGFLAGLGMRGALPELSRDASEALEDLQQIARADHGGDDRAEPLAETEDEDDEKAFTEIVEYVRIVTLLLREELRGPRESDAIH